MRYFHTNNSATTPYKCPLNKHNRPQQVISNTYDFLQYEKTGEILIVVFTGFNF